MKMRLPHKRINNWLKQQAHARHSRDSSRHPGEGRDPETDRHSREGRDPETDRHSRGGGNPVKTYHYWMPGQARHDKRTCYSSFGHDAMNDKF